MDILLQVFDALLGYVYTTCIVALVLGLFGVAYLFFGLLSHIRKNGV